MSTCEYVCVCVHNCAMAAGGVVAVVAVGVAVVVMRGLHFIYLSVYRLLSTVWATKQIKRLM